MKNTKCSSGSCLYRNTGNLDVLTEQERDFIIKVGEVMDEIEIALLETLADNLEPNPLGRVIGIVLYEISMQAIFAAAAVATEGAAAPLLAIKWGALTAKIGLKFPKVAKLLDKGGAIYEKVEDLIKSANTAFRKAPDAEVGEKSIAGEIVDKLTDKKDKQMMPDAPKKGPYGAIDLVDDVDDEFIQVMNKRSRLGCRSRRFYRCAWTWNS